MKTMGREKKITMFNPASAHLSEARNQIPVTRGLKMKTKFFLSEKGRSTAILLVAMLALGIFCSLQAYGQREFTAKGGSTVALFPATSGKAQRDVIIVEGFDPLNHSLPGDIYEKGRDIFDIARSLYKLNLWIVNFGDGGRPIEENANDFKELAKAINNVSSSPNNNVVLGFSMGGVVARYAIADTYPNDNLGIAKFISYNSPHRGAWINPDIYQAAQNYQGDWDNHAKEIIGQVESPAAQQLLTGGSGHKAFYDKLRSKAQNGYNPRITYVALTNGSYRTSGPITSRELLTYDKWIIFKWREKTIYAKPEDQDPGDFLPPKEFKETRVGIGLIIGNISLAGGEVKLHFGPTFVPTHSALDFDGTLVQNPDGSYQYKDTRSPFNRVYINAYGGSAPHDDFSIHAQVILQEAIDKVPDNAPPLPVYRLYNGKDHFYTTSASESDSAQRVGYRYEGIAFQVFAPDAPNTTPFYRLFLGNGDHFYTADESEKNRVISSGARFEGVLGNVATTQEKGTVPLYRLYNVIDHFYTINASERDAAIRGGYNYEGIACYVLAPPAAAPPIRNLMPEFTAEKPTDSKDIPKVFQLGQNYPNPFNPETWVPYQLAEEADVTLRIYNSKGQLVRTLDLGHQNAGNYLDKAHAAYWDGMNERGERVTSGVYFYQIKAGGFTAMRKMVVVK